MGTFLTLRDEEQTAAGWSRTANLITGYGWATSEEEGS